MRNLTSPATSGIKLGIGIVTYNRAERLLRCVNRLLQHTTQACEILIADDGSSDATKDAVRALAGSGVRYLGCGNMGVNWNKNRILYYFNNLQKCDVVIILEDDCYPCADHWQQVWVEGALRWGHINVAGEWFAESFEPGGEGTVGNPHRSMHVSAQCVGFSREAIEYVGFFDPVLERFGGGHAEHSYRMTRAGYGGEFRRLNEIGCPWFYLIESQVGMTRLDSGFEFDDSAGFEKYYALRDGMIYRAAWRDEAEHDQLWDEMSRVVVL